MFELPNWLEGAKAARDESGNIVLLEPASLDVRLPEGAHVAPKPETRPTRSSGWATARRSWHTFRAAAS